MMQRGWFGFMHPAPGPLPPTMQRTQLPVVVLHMGVWPVQSAIRHARQLREVESQMGLSPMQSAATFGRHAPQMLFCGIVASGMKQRWLLGQSPFALQRMQRPLE
jgi:hypothetical protein